MSRFVRRQWSARPLSVFSACFLLGVICGEHFYLSAAVSLVIALLFWGAYALIGCRRRHRWVLLPLIAAFLLGNARMIVALNANPPAPERFSVEFEGTVVSDPTYNEATVRLICVLQLEHVDGVETKCRVRLYLRSEELPLEGIEYGQHLTCFGHVWPQEAATNPYQYDSMKALLADGLAGMAAAKMEDVQITPSGPSLGKLRLQIWHAISDRISELFPENADIVRAFVLGDRTGLEAETKSDFSQTGITHLICISGLHISVLAAAVAHFLSLFSSRRAAVFGTLAVIILYGFLIGFPASLVRATVMFAAYSLASVAGRPSDPITRLSAAMLLMLLINPFNIYDGGFVLSFGASAGILLLSEPIESLLGIHRLRQWKPHPNRILRLGQALIRYFPLLLCTTLAAQLATLPAVIGYFGAQPLISIPVNLLAIPIAMLAYPLALIALALSTLWMALGQGVALLSEAMFTALLKLIHAFAMLPAGALRSPCFPAWLVFIHCLVVLLASGLNRLPLKIRRFMPLLLVALIGVSILNAWIQSLGFSVVFLDAGQADSAVIRADGHVYIYDTGDLYSPVSDFATGGCLGVDAVFLSHPHYDHVAGLIELLDEMPPNRIYVPAGWFDIDASESVTTAIETAQQMGIPIVELSSGDELHPTDDIALRVYSPDGSAASANDLSLLLEIVCDGHSVLFTGDLSRKGEPDVLPDVDVLKVPHHGSANACSDPFLAATSPKVAVISVGENNYGHPSEETLDRLDDSGAEVYRTDECGAVTVRFRRNGEIDVNTYLSMEALK